MPGHYVANCPENKKAGNFSEDEFNRVQKSGYDKKYESEGKKYKSPKSEKDFSPPRKKSSLPGKMSCKYVSSSEAIIRSLQNNSAMPKS